MARRKGQDGVRAIKRYVEAGRKDGRVEVVVSEYGIAFIRRRIMNGHFMPDWSDWQHSTDVQKQIGAFPDNPAPSDEEILARLPGELTVRSWVSDSKYPPLEFRLRKMHDADYYCAKLWVPRYKSEAPDPKSKRGTSRSGNKKAHIPLANDDDFPTSE